jgi:hypothetical protein
MDVALRERLAVIEFFLKRDSIKKRAEFSLFFVGNWI